MVGASSAGHNTISSTWLVASNKATTLTANEGSKSEGSSLTGSHITDIPVSTDRRIAQSGVDFEEEVHELRVYLGNLLAEIGEGHNQGTKVTKVDLVLAFHQRHVAESASKEMTNIMHPVSTEPYETPSVNLGPKRKHEDPYILKTTGVVYELQHQQYAKVGRKRSQPERQLVKVRKEEEILNGHPQGKAITSPREQKLAAISRLEERYDKLKKKSDGQVERERREKTREASKLQAATTRRAYPSPAVYSARLKRFKLKCQHHRSHLRHLRRKLWSKQCETKQGEVYETWMKCKANELKEEEEQIEADVSATCAANEATASASPSPTDPTEEPNSPTTELNGAEVTTEPRSDEKKLSVKRSVRRQQSRAVGHHKRVTLEDTGITSDWLVYRGYGKRDLSRQKIGRHRQEQPLRVRTLQDRDFLLTRR
jgi:hypothetical protein